MDSSLPNWLILIQLKIFSRIFFFPKWKIDPKGTWMKEEAVQVRDGEDKKGMNFCNWYENTWK